MELVTELTGKGGTELQPGELVILPRGSGLGLTLAQHDNSRTLFGLLQKTERGNPFEWVELGGALPYISYGTKWLLDVDVGPETIGGNPKRHDLPAQLFLQNSSLIIPFRAPENSMHYGAYDFDLTTNAMLDLTNDAVPIAVWRIWSSRATMSLKGAPLLEIKLQ